MKHLKHISILFIAVLALLLLLTPKAEAATVAIGTCGDDAKWYLTDDGTLTVYGSGAMDNWLSLSSVPWRSERSSIKKVVIRDEVTTIGKCAFYGCTNLTSVTIGSGVTAIGIESFAGCTKLQSVVIPASVTEIGTAAFADCGQLTLIKFEGSAPGFATTSFSNVTASAYYPAGNPTWTSRVLKDYGGTITWASYTASGTCGDDLLWMMNSLGSLAIVGTGAMDDWTYNFPAPWDSDRASVKKVIIGNDVTTVGRYAFYGCTNLTSVSIGKSVTKIGIYAFAYCEGLTSVTAGGKVTEIDDYAFSNCTGLQSATIGNSVTAIGACAFNGCTDLQSVTIGSKVASIGKYAFNGCTALQSVIIPDSVTTIDDYAFSNCTGLTSVTIGDSVTTIGGHAFYNCKGLASVTIPDSVTTIGNSAFYYCDGLQTVTIGNGVTTIGDGAFQSCTFLQSVTIGSGVTTIGDSAFYNCKCLETVTIPDSVTTIGKYAFAFNSYLTSVTVGKGVTTIGEAAFANCMYVQGVYISDLKAWCEIDFEAFSSTPLYFGQKLYLNNELVSGDLVIPDGTERIAMFAFHNCDELTSVTIPDSVTAIEEYAFYSCGGLETVTIPDSVTAIGEKVFYLCDGLRSVTVPGSVTAIDNQVFGRCTSLEEIVFEGSAPSFGTDIFENVTATAYYPAEDSTWTEEVRQNYGGTITWVAVKFDIDAARMILGNSLEFQFGIAQAKLPENTGCYAVIQKGDVIKTVPAAQWGASGQYWTISYDGLAAKEMADELILTIYNKEGEAISNPKTDSARSYVMRNINSQNAKCRTMMVDMLNYGAAAQTHFGYNTDDLANNLLTETQKAWGTQTMETVTDVRAQGPHYKGTRLILESRIQMQVAFEGLTADMYATYTYTDHCGKEQVVTVEGKDFVDVGSGMYAIELNQLVYADARQPVKTKVFYADGTVYGGAKDSIESYVNRLGQENPVCLALMKFTDSARAYLHQ